MNTTEMRQHLYTVLNAADQALRDLNQGEHINKIRADLADSDALNALKALL